jgi:exodeoxyribonuclease VIII
MTTTMEIQPGIYPDMPNEAYHSGIGISKTGLDWIAEPDSCPALFRAKYITREIEEKSTDALDFGKAGHLAVFQPDQFGNEVAVCPEVNKRTNAGKAEYASFCAENEGKTIISAGDYEIVNRVADAVRRHPVAQNILAKGQAEASMFSTDQSTGELIKVRPDWFVEDVMADLKLMRSASPQHFEKEMWNRRYFVQAPFYLDTAGEVLGRTFNSFVFIVAEKEPPFLVELYFASPEALSAGRIEYRRNLDLYHQCKVTDTWPGYNRGKIQPVSIPYWALRNIETAIAD